MSRVGSASLDENRKTKGGKAGDQTSKEVYITSFYLKNWSYVLRAKDKNIANRIADSCEKGCNNQHIGYDQNQRLTLRTQAKLAGMNLDLIKTDCECDCSSFVAVCCECAGIPIPYPSGNAPTTSNMKSLYLNTGYFDLLTDSEYLTSDKKLCRGDILVQTGSHTVIVLDDGKLADISQKAVNIDMQKAVDISKYNIVTDYKAMASQIKNVIIRIGYRSSSSGNIVEDDLFQKHIMNCLANNMNIGIYFYDQSVNEQEAIEQADWVINKIQPYDITLPIYIDSESSPSHTGRADNISKEQRTKNLIAFCNRIAENKKLTGFYSGNSWYKTNLLFDKLVQTGYSIWVARYSTQKPDIPKYDIWQYGSELFSWGQGAIDVNHIYNLPSDIQKPQNEANTSEIKGNDVITINNKVQVSDFLNIRLQPLINSPIVGKLYNNNTVQIFGYTHDWYMINTTMNNWVNAKYIKTNMAKTTANLNYREGVGTNSKSLGIYEKGTKVKVLNRVEWTDGNWILCLDDKDRFGWCSEKYLKMI